MNKLVFQFPLPAAPFQCPLAPFTQQLSPAFGRIADMDFFPEGLFLSSKAKAAAFFDASVDTLDEWIAKGLITPYKRGRVYFFPIAGLAQAMNHPAIWAFIKKKAEATRRSPLQTRRPIVSKVKYRLLPIPMSEHMFLLIRYKKKDIAWLCSASLLKDEKSLKSFISQVISLYSMCQNIAPSVYQKN